MARQVKKQNLNSESNAVVHCAFDEMVSVEELKSHPKNRNKHPKNQIKRLAEILKYQGWRYPVKVSKLSGCVTPGHGRIEAARLNGWKEVPVNYQDYSDEAQEYADVQADNAIASWSELDFSAINTDIGDLGPDFDIDMLGIDDFVIEPAEFLPGTEEDQGQLDQKKFVFMECPHCKEQFEKGQARVLEN